MSPTESRLLLATDHVSVESGALAEPLRLPFAARDDAAAAAALGAALADVQRRGGKAVRLRLAGSWLRWQSLPWGVAVGTLNGGRLLAAPQAYRLPGLAAQVPDAILHALENAPHGLRLEIAAVPEMAVALARRQAGRSAVVIAVLEADCLTFLRLQAGFLVDAVAVPRSAADTDVATSVATAWRRLTLRDANFERCTLRLLLDAGNTMPNDMTPAGFSRMPNDQDSLWRGEAQLPWPRRHSPWRRWQGAAFAASFALFLVAGTHFQFARQARDAALQQDQARVTTVVPAAVRNPAEQKAHAMHIGRVNAAIRQLNAPVDQLLQAARPRRDSGIALLGVQLRSGGERRLTVEGKADSMAAMAAYVKHLSAQPVLTSVWLSRHEGAQTEQGGGYRFLVEAGWQE